MTDLTDEDIRPLTPEEIEANAYARLIVPIAPTILSGDRNDEYEPQVYSIGSLAVVVADSGGVGSIEIDGIPVTFLVDPNSDRDNLRLYHIQYGTSDGITSSITGDLLALAPNEDTASAIYLNWGKDPIITLDAIEPDDIGL